MRNKIIHYHVVRIFLSFWYTLSIPLLSIIWVRRACDWVGENSASWAEPRPAVSLVLLECSGKGCGGSRELRTIWVPLIDDGALQTRLAVCFWSPPRRWICFFFPLLYHSRTGDRMQFPPCFLLMFPLYSSLISKAPSLLQSSVGTWIPPSVLVFFSFIEK